MLLLEAGDAAGALAGLAPVASSRKESGAAQSINPWGRAEGIARYLAILAYLN